MTELAHKPSVGSISHGTHRTADLLYAFGVELDYLRGNDTSMSRVYALFEEDTTEIAHGNEEAAASLLETLRDELEELAPPYCYFGAHEGDGADFGFWPSHEEIEELPHIADPAEAESHLGEDCAFVNDHGNVTVYGADGRVILEFV